MRLFAILFSISVIVGCSQGIDEGGESNTVSPNHTDNRVNSDLVVLYRFNELQGSTIHDSSNFETAQDLIIGDTNSIEWKNPGIALLGSAQIHSSTANSKVLNAIEASQELSIEVWIKPSADTSNYGAIFTQAGDVTTHNFMFSQSLDGLGVKLRTLDTYAKGEPELFSSADFVKPEITHVTATWRRSEQMIYFYINGELVTSLQRTGKISWENLELRIGYELGSDGFSTHEWQGEIYLAALYHRALTANEVKQNYLAGVNAN